MFSVSTSVVLAVFFVSQALGQNSTTVNPSASSTVVLSSSASRTPNTTKPTEKTSEQPSPSKEGPIVILKLIVWIVKAIINAVNLLALKASVQSDVKAAFTSEGFSIKSTTTLNISFNSPLNIIIELAFYSGIPPGKTIEGVFQAALESGKIRNLTESNTNYTVTFTGVTLKYNPKDGQCQAICCGSGGALKVERVCTPEDRCEGIEPDEKEEEDHCPGEEKATCPDTCSEDGNGGIHNSPSYALVTLLAIATFTKMMFF